MASGEANPSIDTALGRSLQAHVSDEADQELPPLSAASSNSMTLDTRRATNLRHSDHGQHTLPSPRSSPSPATRAVGERRRMRRAMANGRSMSISREPMLEERHKAIEYAMPDRNNSPFQEHGLGAPFIELRSPPIPGRASPGSHLRRDSHGDQLRPHMSAHLPPPAGFQHDNFPPEGFSPTGQSWANQSWSNGPAGGSPMSLRPEGVPHPHGGPPMFPDGPQPMMHMHPGPPFLQTQFQSPMGMRPDRAPLSGYELLAAKLAGTIGGPPIKPIYRRFASLNHRLLLRLQDEIVDLEDQLHMLDVREGHNRQFPGGFHPASLRHERNAPDLFIQKTEILGQVGFKLDQYNKVLASFKETLALPPPAQGDIHEYRTWLAAARPVIDEEAMFLDAVDDLVALQQEWPVIPNDNGAPMMIHQNTQPQAGFPPGRQVSDAVDTKGAQPPGPREMVELGTLGHIVVAVFASILAPIITFAVIPSFVARMTVVLLVGSGALTLLVQSGSLRQLADGRGVLDWGIGVGVYLVAMAVIAAAFG
ncbi:hypothetical protein S7711_04311 [Stachybotrys chartarum IBT 7711]|uniref:DUF6594 domain-containing protein n=1 Tax=Stachybotrys chartarum (strain CBS 109288 / IBT 7711) TaxID=1280523 RepID=A0A084AJD4_STACB|nr:hypothetical protein S7711_04311 [Stachybotrys chartarum IBT 7711]